MRKRVRDGGGARGNADENFSWPHASTSRNAGSVTNVRQVSYELVRYLLQALYDTDVADSEIVATVLKDRNGPVLSRTL